jgi:hypothetical protein
MRPTMYVPLEILLGDEINGGETAGARKTHSYKILLGKSERKMTFGRLRCRWDNIKRLEFQFS